MTRPRRGPSTKSEEGLCPDERTTGPEAGRLVALDVLRGFTILVMIFVNDAASVRGLPPWLYHMPPGANGMTFVDVVFPAFLFMVGTAIPLAFARRRDEGTAFRPWLSHVVVRALSLVAIGVLVMNGRELDPVASHVPYAVWNAGMLLAVIVVWQRDPEAAGKRRTILRGLRLLAIAVLIVLVGLYRAKGGGWLDLTNWSILGSIGWAYLTASLIERGTRGRRGLLVAALVALVAWNVATRLGVAPITWIARHVPPLGNGGSASIVMCGILAVKVLVGASGRAHRATALLAYAAVLTAGGAILAPRFGIAKIGATPSWCLFSAAITTVLLALFDALLQEGHTPWWSVPLSLAGRNALLVYLLPDIFYAIAGLQWLDAQFGEGPVGLVRAAALAVSIVLLGAVLTRQRIRMVL